MTSLTIDQDNHLPYPRGVAASGKKPEIDRLIEGLVVLFVESRQLLRQASEGSGLTPTQLAVLKLLAEVDGLSLSELSERIRTHASAMTGIVDRMEQDGLVVRERSAKDRRVVRLRLTPRGLELAQVTPVPRSGALRAAFDSLEKDERRELIRLLGKLVSTLTENGKTKSQERKAS